MIISLESNEVFRPDWIQVKFKDKRSSFWLSMNIKGRASS
jgi:hypothetical protein